MRKLHADTKKSQGYVIKGGKKTRYVIVCMICYFLCKKVGRKEIYTPICLHLYKETLEDTQKLTHVVSYL